MNKAGWFKDHDLQKVVSEMKIIRSVSINGTRKKRTTEQTLFPKLLYIWINTGNMCIILEGILELNISKT